MITQRNHVYVSLVRPYQARSWFSSENCELVRRVISPLPRCQLTSVTNKSITFERGTVVHVPSRSAFSRSARRLISAFRFFTDSWLPRA